jgi:SAM-dependent methyltransferase
VTSSPARRRSSRDPTVRRGTRIAALSRLRESEAYFDAAYFSWQGDSAERSARAVVPLVLERLRPTRVVDVGCGSGAWLKVFREHGVADIVGVDGPYVQPEALRIRPQEFVARDLGEPFRLDRDFDLAVSLEAAHYVPRENASALVESIAMLAPAVLFGAAVPHQPGGPAHNRQWPAWWAALFAEHGFRAEDWLRPLVWEDEQVDWWYAQNAILYLRDGGEGEPVRPLVHPGLLEEVARPPGPPKRRRFLRRY